MIIESGVDNGARIGNDVGVPSAEQEQSSRRRVDALAWALLVFYRQGARTDGMARGWVLS